MLNGSILEKWDDPKCKYQATFIRLIKGTKDNLTTNPIRAFRYTGGDYVLDYGLHSVAHKNSEIKSITKL